MIWFGPVSAWAAAIVGAAMLGLAVLQYSWGNLGWGPALAGMLLLVGSFRTLRAMSGGLRLLAGAWGVIVGLMMPAAPADVSLSYSVPLGSMLTAAIVSLPFVALAGLALTVLHKEQKKAPAAP